VMALEPVGTITYARGAKSWLNPSRTPPVQNAASKAAVTALRPPRIALADRFIKSKDAGWVPESHKFPLFRRGGVQRLLLEHIFETRDSLQIHGLRGECERSSLRFDDVHNVEK